MDTPTTPEPESELTDHEDELLDETNEESFPASDPPASGRFT